MKFRRSRDSVNQQRRWKCEETERIWWKNFSTRGESNALGVKKMFHFTFHFESVHLQRWTSCIKNFLIHDAHLCASTMSNKRNKFQDFHHPLILPCIAWNPPHHDFKKNLLQAPLTANESTCPRISLFKIVLTIEQSQNRYVWWGSPLNIPFKYSRLHEISKFPMQK